MEVECDGAGCGVGCWVGLEVVLGVGGGVGLNRDCDALANRDGGG